MLRTLALLLSVLGATHAAEPKPIARHDPPGQLFRRAPMAQSARSVVVNLATNLHAAFDTELGRLHTVWKGGPLNLWGPPYSHSKSPFIADFEGEQLYSFPGVIPWFILGRAAEVQFLGIRMEGGNVQFEYSVSGSGQRVLIVETLAGAATEGDWSLERNFEFPEGSGAHLRYLAGILRTESKAAPHFKTEGGFRFSWDRLEADYYTSGPITEASTEKKEPAVHHTGQEQRVFVEIPGKKERFSFRLWTGNSDAPLPIAKREKVAVKTFTAATEKRRDSGDEHYRIEHFPLPPEAELVITGMDWWNERDLAVCTWLGEIYIVENATGAVAGMKFRRFARGLNEPLGLTVANGDIFVVQKGELTRVVDSDKDGEADWLECVNDEWGYSGNYHSYSFGPLVTGSGEMMVFVTGQRGRYDLPYQGWAIRADAKEAKPFCSGLRVPHGWASYQGDVFVTDNQGNWIGACRLNHLQEGKFYGYPSSRPAEKGAPSADQVEPPALWFPRSLAPSASGMEVITNDAFGPFRGQMLIGDFQNSILMRASLEKVRGKWQGAVFPFTKGFLSGVNRLKLGADGKLYVGGGKRTWSNAAPKEFSLDRVTFSGKVPFEVSEVRVIKGGFELRFTKPLESEPARDPENYLIKQFNYKYHADYGSPELDHAGKTGVTETPAASVKLSDDRRMVRLSIPALKVGYVTAFQLAVNSEDGEDLRNDTFHYTLNNLPE